MSRRISVEITGDASAMAGPRTRRVIEDGRKDIPPENWPELDKAMEGTLRYQQAKLGDALADCGRAIMAAFRR